MNSKLVKSLAVICLPASVWFGCAGGSNDKKQGDTIEHAPAPYGPLPSAAQLNWHEMEAYCLIHFTPTTFENKEWGYGDASPAIFNPVHFDANQIAAAARSAGLQGLVSVAKHHDGFCLFPTKATAYNISKSPWRDGKGDMVKEFMEATRKQGMQFGAYCSAWDRNDSAYGTPGYVQHYRQELTDLYSNYGPLFISWHDGANGGDGYYGGAKEKRIIDRSVYYNWPSIWEITRKLQPGAVIFSDIGPDVRWVGNERGMAGETCWATFTPVGPEGKNPAPGFVDDRFLTTGQRDGKYWIPAECDVPLRPGWFYHPDQDDKVKSPDQLFDLYLQSVGRGACLNLGLSPNTEGLLHNNDVASLKAFGDKLHKTFADNLAKDAVFAASNIRDKNDKDFGTAKLTDDDRYSYWATDDRETKPELIIDLKAAKRFNIIRLRENIKLGQRLDSVVMEQWQNGQWQPLAAATSIGSTRLIRLPAFITTQKLRIRFFAPVCIALSDIGLFAEAPADYTAINKTRLSLGHEGWKVIAGSASAGRSKAALAFDGDKNTFWQTAAGNLPQQITIDLGGVKELKAFSWLPRQDSKPEGLISKYIFETSPDGKQWTISAEGEFSNIIANPIEQYVPLRKNAEARFIRLQATAVADADNAPANITIAELNVF
jgi:alpha-L-fucosidase